MILIEWLNKVKLPVFPKEQNRYQNLYDKAHHALPDAENELMWRETLGHIGGNCQVINIIRDL